MAGAAAAREHASICAFVTLFYTTVTHGSEGGSLSTLRLDRRSGVGLAAQIRSWIALRIADGQLGPGDSLPPLRVLARELGVNVNTVRAAYTRLESDGLVRTRHGVGSVVQAETGLGAAAVPAVGANSVVVLIGGLDPFYLSMLRGIEDIAAERGILVLIADTRDSPTIAAAMIRRLRARGVDGILAVSVGDMDDGSGPEPVSDRPPPPIVYVDQPDRTGHVLLFDGRGAGHAATRHLVEHGHRRIGLVTAPLTWPNVREVHRGYLQALENSGKRASCALVSEVDEFSIEAGRRGLAKLLEAGEPPTAVFATGDTLALGVLREAKDSGLAVPNDLAIVGYTDSGVATLVEPALTMVEVPARDIGVRAMRILVDLIRGRKPRPRRVVLPTELVVRDSCGIHNG
jgi:DNA-binding LacI/PurR family transcriptional regulator